LLRGRHRRSTPLPRVLVFFCIVHLGRSNDQQTNRPWWTPAPAGRCPGGDGSTAVARRAPAGTRGGPSWAGGMPGHAPRQPGSSAGGAPAPPGPASSCGTRSSSSRSHGPRISDRAAVRVPAR
jgi:hypothetical protein